MTAIDQCQSFADRPLSGSFRREPAIRSSSGDGPRKGGRWILSGADIQRFAYGAGLRISEALALTRTDLEADTLRVTGKGGKTRIVPLIAPVRQAIERYLALAPFHPDLSEPVFRGARGVVLSPRLIQLRM